MLWEQISNEGSIHKNCRIQTEYYVSMLIRRFTSLRVACVKSFSARPKVEGDAILHRQREVIQTEGLISLCASLTYVSKSDILGPNSNLSDIKNLVSFEREWFVDSSYQ